MRLIFTLICCVVYSGAVLAQATFNTFQGVTNNGDGTATIETQSNTINGEDAFAEFRVTDAMGNVSFITTSAGTCAFNGSSCDFDIVANIPMNAAMIEVQTFIVRTDGFTRDLFTGFQDVTAALPISLTTFTATPETNRVALSWETALERNNDYFTIERSADGKVFTAIAMIEGAGTTERARQYTAYDEAPLAGTNYYRLRQTDYDGSTAVFEVVSVELRGDDQPINAFPNPVRHELTVTLSQREQLQLFDVNGQRVLLRNAEAGTQSLDLSALPAGLYYLRSASGSTTVVKE